MKDHGPIDITTLTRETPKPRETLPFDPERDITEAEWNKMARYLEKAREEVRQEGTPLQQRAEDAYMYVTRLSSAMILSPERFRQFSRANDILLLLLREQLAPLIESEDLMAVIACACNYKLAFAKTTAELDEEDELQSKIFEECLKVHTHKSFLNLASGAVILFPSILPQIGLDENDWYTTQHAIQNAQHSDLRTQSEILRQAKLVFPEKVSGFVDQAFWRKARQALESYRKQSMDDFFYLAEKLAIIAAQKVEITDRGIELVFDRSEPFTAPTPPMPPIRKF